MSSKTDKKKAVVPKLRFPEFRDAGPWEVKRLGEVFRERTERNGSGLELLSVTLFDGVVRASQLDRKVNVSSDLSNYKKVYPNDIVYNSMRMWQGASGVSKWHGIVSPAYTVVEPLENHNSLFWAYHFKVSESIEKFARYSQGVTSDTWNLKFPAFSLIRMAFPSPTEQQKIADCLSSLHDVIELQTKKLEVLKAHKKGLMQQLFPREGETTPRLRFPEFRDAGPWEVKKIEDFFRVLSSKRVLQKDWTNHGVPFYRTRELVSLYKNEPFSSEVFISEELFSELANKYGVPTSGDFLVSGVGTLGIAYQVQDSDKFYFKDGNVLWFKLKGGIVSTFFKYCFQSDFIQNQILGKTSISTVGTFTIQDAKKTKLLCPSDIEEQQKIADCLSSLDEVIELQTKKIEALKAHKKGLMQQLFPQEVG